MKLIFWMDKFYILNHSAASGTSTDSVQRRTGFLAAWVSSRRRLGAKTGAD